MSRYSKRHTWHQFDDRESDIEGSEENPCSSSSNSDSDMASDQKTNKTKYLKAQKCSAPVDDCDEQMTSLDTKYNDSAKKEVNDDEERKDAEEGNSHEDDVDLVTQNYNSCLYDHFLVLISVF